MRSLRLALALIVLPISHSIGQTENTIHTDTTSTEMHACCTNNSCCSESIQTPIGVSTDHIHHKGQWMISYTYMGMMMQGNRVGTKKVNDNTVYQSYMMSPDKMNMQMHMLMLMYGVSNRFTVMAMGGYTLSSMSMNMLPMIMPGMTMPSSNMISSSSGLSDTKLYGLYNLAKRSDRRVVASLGVSIPTGTVRATGTTMLGENQRLPYDMQPGTGSFSLLPAIAYGKSWKKFAYGAEAGADVKLNKNDIGYKVGNVYHATVWSSYQFRPFVSGSLRAEGVQTDKITGSDPAVDIAVYQNNDPTTRTENYGGKWLNIYAGLNFHTDKKSLSKFRLLLEYGMPAYEHLNGLQMSQHSNLMASVSYSL